MPRQLCLGHAQPLKRQRARAPRTSNEDKPRTFTILERVPVRLGAHSVVWAALRKLATRQLIIDAEHPEEAFPADVLLIDRLSADALRALTEALAERRSLMLDAEKHGADSDVLAKRLDRIFEREMEWISIRNLLAAGLTRARGTTRQARGTRHAKGVRALLLLDL
jgi:hypothetical protein